jgi:Leucine-rich repeat (LRR) protein
VLELNEPELKQLGELWQIPFLTKLSFANSRIRSVDVLNACSSLTNLISLNLSNINLNDSHLTPLSQFTYLLALNLSKNNELTVKGLVTALRPLTRLVTLILSDVPNIREKIGLLSSVLPKTLVRLSQN